MDEDQLIIGQDSDSSFSYLSTWKVAITQVFGLVFYGIAVIVLSVKDFWFFKRCDVILLICYCQAGLWVIHLIVDHYYKWQHHLLFLKGHFEIYKQLSKYTTLSFAVLSLFNAVFLLFAGSVFYKLNWTSGFCDKSAITAPTVCANIIVGIQIVALSYILIYYSAKIFKYNESQPVPDVRRVSFWAPENSSTVLEVGYRDKEEDSVDLLQKQADLIQYYKGKIAFLNETIIKLSQNSVEC